MHLADRDPQADDEARAAAAARHAASASRRNRSRRVLVAAPRVGAQVRARVEELRRQVAVRGHDLDAVEARPLQPRPRPPRTRRRSRAISAAVIARGHDVEPLGRARRRAPSATASVPSSVSMISRPPWNSCPNTIAPCAVDGLGQGPVARDACRRCPPSARWRCSAPWGGRRPPGSRSARPHRAPWPPGRRPAVGDEAVLGHHRVVARREIRFRIVDAADRDRARTGGRRPGWPRGFPSPSAQDGGSGGHRARPSRGPVGRTRAQ